MAWTVLEVRVWPDIVTHLLCCRGEGNSGLPMVVSFGICCVSRNTADSPCHGGGYLSPGTFEGAIECQQQPTAVLYAPGRNADVHTFRRGEEWRAGVSTDHSMQRKRQ
jgi:hypothetical protein